MEPVGHPLATNRLLDHLPPRDRRSLLSECERVELDPGEVIAKPGDPVRHVYFPTDSFISLLAPMDGRGTLEVGLAGNEGLYGLPVALGVAVSPVHARVEGGGPAWRVGAAAFRGSLARHPSLRACVDGYAHVAMCQLLRAAGCNRFHRVEQRVARWLLMTADRAHTPSFHVTHEDLARTLGVRRVGITQAASALQKDHLIAYARGALVILDRGGLERVACSCYRLDLLAYGAVFG